MPSVNSEGGGALRNLKSGTKKDVMPQVQKRMSCLKSINKRNVVLIVCTHPQESRIVKVIPNLIRKFNQEIFMSINFCKSPSNKPEKNVYDF